MSEPIKKYGGYLIAEGESFSIICAITKSGNSPFWEYFLELKEKYLKKFEKGKINKRDSINLDFTVLRHYFEKFCSTGPWSNKDQLRSLEDGFFEFKNIDTGLRIPFYYDDINRRVIVLTHYFEKDGQKTPPKEKERMKDIKRQFEEFRKLGGSKL